MCSKSITRSSLLTIYLVMTEMYIVESLNLKLEFSRGVSNDRILKRISHITVSKCSNECKARSRCKRAIYSRAAKVCSLTQEADSLDYVVKKGVVLLTGFDGLRMTDASCGSTVCSEFETCVRDIGGVACKITECGFVGNALQTVRGNMFSVHSKLYISYGTSIGPDTTLVCGSDGQWVRDIRSGCCDVGCQSEIVWLYQFAPYYCDMDTDGGKWMVFQRRQDGSEDFYRPWSDYVNGFGNLKGEFWLGLDSMYTILSSGNFELRIDMEDFSGDKRYAKYSQFSIDGETDRFRLVVSGFTGNAGDSFANEHNGSSFSTYDLDNDNQFPGHCAQKYKGGWWYNNCHHSNLNGLYPLNGPDTQFGQYLNWYSWYGHHTSLKATEMKFRRVF